ncbi:hypothetical protein BN890_26680 [Bacteroides xylanisolvens SD CC 1b]|uniref:Helix-turn-helix domain-containing protein n=1 Tax=Bacteroides xylanisolvens SD CC 1b TaxID=702447 RepID=W6PB33_9BACE|nr:hypothetical protein BN890_26680 [Bacteroides xylanisolvens SD CC 1b]
MPNFAAEKQKKGQNMKVITIESSAFTALTEQIAEIAVYVRAVSDERKGESSDMLLTTREAAHLLNVSTRTLQRMRSEETSGSIARRARVSHPPVGNRPPARRLHRGRRCSDTDGTETQPHAAHGRRQTQRKEDIRYGTAYTKQF